MGKRIAALLLLLCLLTAAGCAQRGDEAAEGTGKTPASSAPGPAPTEGTETEVPTAGSEIPAEETEAMPPHGGRVLVLGEGKGKPLEDFTFAPVLKILVDGKEYETARPSCTWTKDGQTLIACGMEPFEFGKTMDPIFLSTPPASEPDKKAVNPELVFERNPDRMTVTVRYRTRSAGTEAWDGTEYGEPSEREYYEPENGYLFPMFAECVFTIEAEWDETDGFGGTGVYVFHTITD